VQYRGNKNKYLRRKEKKVQSLPKTLKRTFLKFMPRKQSTFMPKYFPSVFKGYTEPFKSSRYFEKSSVA
jgi:hypothetical protein